VHKENSMKRSFVLSTVAAALASAVLVACGGGDDDVAPPPPVTSEVPASASASAGGFIDYLKALVKADAEGLEPVDVSAATPPTDDAAEPAVVD
jgi:hypothetical protein